jgi:hypothetical protein
MAPDQDEIEHPAVEKATKRTEAAHLGWIKAKEVLEAALRENHFALVAWVEAKLKAKEEEWNAKLAQVQNLWIEEEGKRRAAEQEIQNLLRPGHIDMKLASLQDQLRLAKRELRKLKEENEDQKRILTLLNAGTTTDAIDIIDTMKRRIAHLSKRDHLRFLEMQKAMNERKIMAIELEQTRAALDAATTPPPRRLPLP